MPSLMLRGLDAALVARIRAYASSQGLGTAAGAIRLLTIALDHLEARQRGGQASSARLTPEQRSARAKHAAAVRDARRQVPCRLPEVS